MVKGKKVTSKDRLAKARTSAPERRKIFQELCRHISQGLALDSFRVMSLPTIEKYLRDYPEEFDRDELDEAVRVGKAFWEDIGRRQSLGTCIGNSRSWYYNMSNRYGWSERQQVDAKTEGNVQVSIVSYADSKVKADE